MKATGGSWDPADKQLIFAAATLDDAHRATTHKTVLFPVDKVSNQAALVSELMDQGRVVLFDSGIFSLAMSHAREHGLTLPQALALPPSAIDGYEKLMATYLEMVEVFGSRCWGYIEMDLGGAENKRRTRASLEAKGLRPIPVYHPLNDGWDYFDELASQYDRLCVGNIVLADKATRARILRTIVERKRAYPGLWVHGLGLGPVALAMALPFESMDASGWLGPCRWPIWRVDSAMTPCSEMSRRYFYRLDADGDDPEGYTGLKRLLGFGLTADQRNWRRHIASQNDGCQVAEEVGS